MVTPNLKKHSQAYNGLLLLIAAVTFLFAVIKMPLEMQILARAGPRRTSINDFYNQRAPRSKVDQHIDAKRSYHFFNREPAHEMSLKGASAEEELALRKEEEEMAKKVDEIVHRELDGPHHEHRHLRSGADKQMLVERIERAAERFLGQKEELEDEEENLELVGDIPHERKEEDPYDKEFSSEVQEIVSRYTQRDEN